MTLRDTINLSKLFFPSFSLCITQEIADIVGSASKMGKERRQEQSLHQIQIENVTRMV